MTVVYLATPIDFAESNVDSIAFMDRLFGLLADAGCTVYYPKGAWTVNGPVTEELARVIEGTNRQALRRSDVVVAWLPEGVPTHGVPAEIEFATRRQGIPTIVIGHAGVALLGNPMVNMLPEHNLDKLGRQIELLCALRAYSDFRIRYSAPEGVDLRTVHDTDAGIDLPASEEVTIASGTSHNVRTGVRVELPVGSFGWIVARSSTYTVHGLQVLPGVIDQGYQGELKVNCLNLSGVESVIRLGDRIGQLLIMHNSLAGFQLTRVDREEVHPHKTRRGTSGFGSSGR